MASLKCPKCSTTLKLPASFTGKAARCPRCQTVLAVPREEDEEVIQAVEVDEDDAPPPRASQRVKAKAATTEGRKARLSNDEEPDDWPRRRRERDEDDAAEDEDDRPRRRRRGKKEKPEGQLVLLLGIGVFLFACLVVFFTLGFHFQKVSYAMLIIGALLVAIGTHWIRSIAKEEGTMEYMMCLIVPFYDTWYALTRLGQTWIPCILIWGGRFFVTGAVILLITHFVREARQGGGAFRPGAFTATAAEVDAEAEQLLRQRGTFEAKAWLGEMNRRRAFSMWGRPAEVQFVNDLYARGAVRVSVADIDNDPDVGEMAEHLIVTMPTEPEKRQAVLALINQRMRDDGPRGDRGQKYELLTP